VDEAVRRHSIAEVEVAVAPTTATRTEATNAATAAATAVVAAATDISTTTRKAFPGRGTRA